MRQNELDDDATDEEQERLRGERLAAESERQRELDREQRAGYSWAGPGDPHGTPPALWTDGGDEGESVEISREAAEVARRELDLLIEETEDEDPDPLTDDVFRAVSELRDALDEESDEWDPEPADLREGETVDMDAHARRNLEQARMLDDAREDAGEDE